MIRSVRLSMRNRLCRRLPISKKGDRLTAFSGCGHHVCLRVFGRSSLFEMVVTKRRRATPCARSWSGRRASGLSSHSCRLAASLARSSPTTVSSFSMTSIRPGASFVSHLNVYCRSYFRMAGGVAAIACPRASSKMVLPDFWVCVERTTMPVDSRPGMSTRREMGCPVTAVRIV